MWQQRIVFMLGGNIKTSDNNNYVTNTLIF